jgi:hypothetical protein
LLVDDLLFSIRVFRRILVVRARQRTRYARPWGIEIEEDEAAQTVPVETVTPMEGKE